MKWPNGPGELPTSNAIQPPFGAPSGPSAGPTDTVPAWLTPGEAVLNRNAAQLAGRGNINALNRVGGAIGYQRGTGNVSDHGKFTLSDDEQGNPVLSPQELDRIYRMQKIWDEMRRARTMNETDDRPAFGFAQGIGYVDPKDVDPIWQEIQLQAPGINVAALRQQAAKSGISGSQISGLISAFMKSRAGNMAANYQAAGSSTPVYGESGYPSAIPVQGYARGENFIPPDLPPDNTFEPPNLNAPPFGNITPPATGPATSYYDDLHDIFNQPGIRFTPNAGQLYSQAMDRAANRIAQGLPPDITYEAGTRSGTPGGYGYNWGTGPGLPPGGGGIGPDAVYGINVGVPSGGLSWRGRSPGFGGRAPQQI